MSDILKEPDYTIPEELLGKKRENVMNWEEVFMLQAIIIASRSKDPNSQVGACIVNDKNQILSLGYNGTPKMWDDNIFPWGKESINENYQKYPYVIHAEMNALLNHKADNSLINGSTIYVTLFPCSNCAKALAQAGVKKVVYLSDKYINSKDNIAAKTCFKYCGIEYVQFPIELQRELLISLRPDEGLQEIEEKSNSLIKKLQNNK